MQGVCCAICKDCQRSSIQHEDRRWLIHSSSIWEASEFQCKISRMAGLP